MTRESVDFSIVEPKHNAIHARLENWGRWCHGSDGRVKSCAMFTFVVIGNARGVDPLPVGTPVDRMDAVKIQKAVAVLPLPNRLALAWSYITKTSPSKQAKTQALTMAGLALAVRDGRQMLVNRGV